MTEVRKRPRRREPRRTPGGPPYAPTTTPRDYATPIPCYLDGFDGRLAAHCHQAPSWIARWVKEDFQWFADRFFADPRVDGTAAEAFRDVFLRGLVHTAGSVSSRDPASTRPVADWRVAGRERVECSDDDDDGDLDEDPDADARCRDPRPGPRR